MEKIKIKGVFPPMITPFTENGDVDYDAHVKNIEKWNNTNLAGYLVLGSNSEAIYLNEEEKLKLIELTVKHAKKGRIIFAGTGMESTRETIALTNKAGKLGANAALVLTPCYYGTSMTDEAIIAFFKEVADNSNIPIFIYNVTKFTHYNISVNAVKELSKYPNIAGMKDSNGDISQLVKFKSVAADDFNLMVGTAGAWYPALTLGIKAGIMALANCAPDECAQVQKYYEEGNHEKAVEIYLRMFPVNNAVTATYGVAGLKYVCNLFGYSAGYVRKPLLPIKEDQQKSISKILFDAKLMNCQKF